MPKIVEHYVQGVEVERELIASAVDGRGRKMRIVRTVGFRFSDRTPASLRRSWESTIGRIYTERYCPATRYDSARWVCVPAREYPAPELNLA